VLVDDSLIAIELKQNAGFLFFQRNIQQSTGNLSNINQMLHALLNTTTQQSSLNRDEPTSLSKLFKASARSFAPIRGRIEERAVSVSPYDA
jgi:hypothetical protein